MMSPDYDYRPLFRMVPVYPFEDGEAVAVDGVKTRISFRIKK